SHDDGEKSTGASTRATASGARSVSGRIVSTGQSARRRTSSATLPSSSRSIPVRPCVPITMRSTACSCAYSRMPIDATTACTSARTTGTSAPQRACARALSAVSDASSRSKTSVCPGRRTWSTWSSAPWRRARHTACAKACSEHDEPSVGNRRRWTVSMAVGRSKGESAGGVGGEWGGSAPVGGAGADAEEGVGGAAAGEPGRERDEPGEPPPALVGEAEREDEQAHADADRAVGRADVDGEAFRGGGGVCHGGFAGAGGKLPQAPAAPARRLPVPSRAGCGRGVRRRVGGSPTGAGKADLPPRYRTSVIRRVRTTPPASTRTTY